jgi:hypothetical protein
MTPGNSMTEFEFGQQQHLAVGDLDLIRNKKNIIIFFTTAGTYSTLLFLHLRAAGRCISHFRCSPGVAFFF